MLGLSLLNQAQPRSLRSKTTIIPTKGFEKKEDARREPGCPAVAQQHKKACGFRKEINQMWHGLRTPNEALFSLKSRIFGLRQTVWADKFQGIWVIFGRFISTHFGTVSPLSMFYTNQQLFLQTLSLYIQIPNFYIGLEFEFGPQRIRNSAIS